MKIVDTKGIPYARLYGGRWAVSVHWNWTILLAALLIIWVGGLFGIDVPSLFCYAMAFGFGALLIGMLVGFPAILIWAAVADFIDSHLRKKG